MEEQCGILRLLAFVVVVVRAAVQHVSQVVPEGAGLSLSHAHFEAPARRWFLRPSDQSRRTTAAGSALLHSAARQADTLRTAQALQFHSMNEEHFFADVNLP